MTHASNVFAVGWPCKTPCTENPAVCLSRVTQGKPGVDSMACATEHCSRKKPAWLTYTASGNIPLCLKTGTGFLSLVTSTFDLTHIYVGPKNRPYFMSAKNVTAWAAVYTVRWFTEPQTVTHPSTNPARRRSTTSVETNVLPLSQTVERENSEYFRTSIIHTCLVYTFPIHHPGSMNTRWTYGAAKSSLPGRSSIIEKENCNEMRKRDQLWWIIGSHSA